MLKKEIIVPVSVCLSSVLQCVFVERVWGKNSLKVRSCLSEGRNLEEIIIFALVITS